MSVASLLDRLNRGPHILPMRGGRREEVGSKDGYFLFLPRAEELARVFPSMYYFPVTLGKHLSEFLVDIEQMHSFPTSLSTYKCSNTDFHIFTEEGLADLATALSRPFIRRKGKIFKPIAAAVAARRPWYIRREQDPTVVLHQWWQEENTENGEEIWTETPLLWTFPDLTSMSKLLISRLKNSYNIDREEARSMKDVDSSHSAAEYASLQDFFTRPINVEALRPWNPEALVAAPADAVLQNIFSIRPDADGYIRHHTVPQVKSTTFHLRRFLFGDETKDNVIKLQYPRNILVLSIHYLSPRDYHRFNSPADWHVTDQIYIPGCTPSVNRESLESREGILHHFERTSLLGTWDPLSIGERLFFSMNLVAARFVGGLSLAWEDKPLHPRGGPKACGPEAINYIEEKKVDIPLCMGQEVSAFRFGSTVVLAFEAPGDVDITSIGECSHALVGETLAVLPEYPRKLLERCNAFFSNYKNPVQYLNALKQHPEYDEPLRQNSLVRSDWRKKEGRVWAEKIRAIERGLGNRYAVGKFLLFQWNSERNPAVVKLSQPAALDRAGGQDKLGHYVPKCFRAKNTIGLRFEGRVSFLELEIPVNGKEALLFESPFKGCVGDEKLGKDTRGVVAFWRVSEGDELQVELRVESGTFSNGESPQLSVISGVLRLKGECKTEWKSMPRAGPTSTVCGPMSLVEKKERVQDVVTLSNADLATTPLYATPVSA
ncbi:phosphatidylserine decarboxylase [Cystoisospora suis]|uniref:Phosphatidylserine decarboxylase n=1 Tax=Cystoisospora suis TaxID=483139 RepID=A0A2C6L9U9_9APIC|nr:phosphatidylserine decarboxylase [Cystoisospora suis]